MAAITTLSALVKRIFVKTVWFITNLIVYLVNWKTAK